MSIRRNEQKLQDLEDEIAELEKAHRGEDPDEEEPKAPTEPKQPVATPEEDEELSGEEKQYKKRYGDLRRHSQKLTDRITALEAQLSAAPNASVPVTKDDVRKWAEDNPKAAALIKAIALEESGEKFKELDRLSTEINKEKGESKILKAHPDFYEIVEDDAFHDWANGQPSFIQDRIYDNPDPEETIWAINLYKDKSGKARVTQDRDASKSVRTKTKTDVSQEASKGRFTESMVDAMSLEEYMEHADQIDKDRKHKDFYDLTGGAR
jgi:BMFP domain-containing protein YqiC